MLEHGQEFRGQDIGKPPGFWYVWVVCACGNGRYVRRAEYRAGKAQRCGACRKARHPWKGKGAL